MNLQNINERIQNEVCFDIINKLKDINLINKYKKTKSVIKKLNNLEEILCKYKIKENIIEKIIVDYLPEIIPPGTKGVIKGNKFNKIIKKYLLNLKLSQEFDIKFEKKHEKFVTSEIPDWYIYHNNTNKIIIGMNLLDLWNGGHQLNRGYKYLIDKNNDFKLLCVICNNIKINSINNKVFKLFKEGFKNDTLCYIKNLKNIIYKYFNLEFD